MKILDCLQYSPEWWEARRGIPTASEFSSIITPKTMKLSAGAEEYVCRLIGDKYTLGSIAPSGFVSPAMRNGTLLEPEARRWYQMERDMDVKQVGFCLSDCGRWGCSPDSLVGDDGLLELKAPMPHTQVRYVLDGFLPVDYRAQCHGQLIVTGRAWVDFASYCPGLPPFMVRVVPDDFTEALRRVLEEFWTMYQERLNRFLLSDRAA